MVPVSWDEALAEACSGLKKAKSQFGPDKMAVLVSPKLTNEENYLSQKLARLALNTNNIGNSAAVAENNALAELFGKNSSTCSFEDISNSDLIFAYGSDLGAEYPVVSLKVKNAVSKGSKLIMINTEATMLDCLSELTLKVSRRVSVELLQTILNYIFHYGLIDDDFVEKRTLGLQVLKKNMKPFLMENWAQAFLVKPSKIIEFIQLYVRAKDPMIIVNADTISAAELSQLGNLALVTGNVARKGAGIIALRGYGNSQGQIDMGVSPDYIPGQEPIFDSTPRRSMETLWGASLPIDEGMKTKDIIEEIKTGQIRGLLVIGGSGDDMQINALRGGLAFKVVVTPVYSEMMSQADVVLSGTTFAETEGTFTSSEQRIQRLHQAIPPMAGKHTWQILCDLSSRLGYPMEYLSASDIFAEISRVVPDYSHLDFKQIPVGGVKLSSCDEQSTFISPQWLEKIVGVGMRKRDAK